METVRVPFGRKVPYKSERSNKVGGRGERERRENGGGWRTITVEREERTPRSEIRSTIIVKRADRVPGSRGRFSEWIGRAKRRVAAA